MTDVESAAVWDDGGEALTVFAVNRDLADAITLETDLRSFAGYQLAEHIVLENPDMGAVNTAEKEAVRPVSVTGRDQLVDGILQSRLAPASWNVIRLEKQ